MGTQPAGSLGTITGGPTYTNGTAPAWWWQVNYDNAPDGWSTEDYLQKSTLPPSPTPAPTPPSAISCHRYVPGSNVPQGYGVPWDVLSANELLIKATCNASDVTVDLGRGLSTQYNYHQGYSYRSGQTTWTPLTYAGTESLIANAWYPKNATATMNLDATQQATDTYILGYLCTWNGTNWQCGCRDSACTQSYWQIQSFKR